MLGLGVRERAYLRNKRPDAPITSPCQHSPNEQGRGTVPVAPRRRMDGLEADMIVASEGKLVSVSGLRNSVRVGFRLLTVSNRRLHHHHDSWSASKPGPRNLKLYDVDTRHRARLRSNFCRDLCIRYFRTCRANTYHVLFRLVDSVQRHA